MKSGLDSRVTGDDFLKSIENLETRNTYSKYVFRYLNYLEKCELTIFNAEERHISEFLDNFWQSTQVATRNVCLATLKSMYNFAHDLGYVNSNPCRGLLIVNKKSKMLRGGASKKDIRKLLRNCGTSKLIDVRDHAMISVIHYCFLKISEALSLQLGSMVQVDGRNFLHISTKKTQRLVPINTDVLSSLTAYIETLPKNLSLDHPLFLTTGGKGKYFDPTKPLQRAAAGNQLRIRLAEINLTNQLCFENIRQAGIQSVVEQGLDLASAKTLYGCKQIDTLSEFLRLPANVDTLFEVCEAT